MLTVLPVGATDRNRWLASAAHVDLRRPSFPARPVTVPARPQAVTIDLARTAIVVVDMQNDFCARGGWLDHVGVDLTPARAPIGPLVTMLAPLRAAGTAVVWLNWGNRPDRANLPPGVLHVYDPDGASVGIGDPLPGSGARVLEAGSWAAAIVDELKPDPADVCVDKYRMSGFWDTSLDSILRNLAVTTLLFAGVNADQCVYATLVDAACLGYDCILLDDASATTSPTFCWDATLYNVAQCFGFVASGAAIVEALR